MIKVDSWLNKMIEDYKSGNKDAFYHYPMGALKKTITERGLERPEGISVSQWLCQLLAVGELTEDDLRLALYETLAERHLAKIESPFFIKRMIYYKDFLTSTIEASREDFEQHPEHLIRFIRTLNTSERGYLRFSVKQDPENIKAIAAAILGKWDENYSYKGDNDVNEEENDEC